MGTSKKKDKSLLILCIIAIVMLTSGVVIPLIYHYFIVGNGEPSSWSEEVWGGFSGGIWGVL